VTTKILQGQTAIVTGAGRGFGKAIAERLAAEGAAVGLVSRSPDQLEAVAAAIAEAGGRAIALPADVTKRADVARVVKTLEAQSGSIDILVNNAGLAGPFGPIGEMDPDEWWQAQAVHVRGPFLFMSAVLPGMRERKKGHIINIASLGGGMVQSYLSAYGVGKNTAIRLTEHVALENKDFGIGVFSIEPGTTITAMAESTINSPDAQKWLPDMIEILKNLKAAQPDSTPVFARCGDMVVALASGKYDRLSGRYLEPEDDFDALLREASPSDK
jgi:NAD(P)-dependent dehydrogenase (short-subunit alcohol dehydrogenase family)